MDNEYSRLKSVVGGVYGVIYAHVSSYISLFSVHAEYMFILGDLICKNYYRIYNGNTTQHN